MAEQLVASMTGDFSADAYHDDYRQALMAVIERKVAGEQPEEPARREAPTNIGDLMAALEASVAAARQSRAHPAAEAASQAEPEALAALNPYASTMLLTTLHWPDEVRSLEELELPEEEISFKPAERAMAEQLVASMTGDFSADDYRDDYRQALMAVIERKVAGEQPQEPIQREAPTNIGDLMAALEASVAAARESRAAAAVTGADVAAAAPAEAAPRRRRKTA
jgi:non-homologous end joining protein Ku